MENIDRYMNGIMNEYQSVLIKGFIFSETGNQGFYFILWSPLPVLQLQLGENECISFYHSTTNIKLNKKLLRHFLFVFPNTFLCSRQAHILASSLLYTLKHRYSVKWIMARLHLMDVNIRLYYLCL